MSEQIAYLPGALPTWSFAERLRKVRRDRGLSQAKFSEQLGVSESAYEAWETGRNRPSDLTELVVKLERLTGVPRQWFLGWLDTPPAPPVPAGSGVGEDGFEPSTFRVEGRRLAAVSALPSAA